MNYQTNCTLPIHPPYVMRCFPGGRPPGMTMSARQPDRLQSAAFASRPLPLSRCRSDKQPAGQPDDPGSRHQGPGQRAEPAEGQRDEAGRREGVAAHPVPGPGGPAETTAPVPGEGLCRRLSPVICVKGHNWAAELFIVHSVKYI